MVLAKVLSFIHTSTQEEDEEEELTCGMMGP